eukprot:6537597-Prymnesium_polylepis.1
MPRTFPLGTLPMYDGYAGTTVAVSSTIAMAPSYVDANQLLDGRNPAARRRERPGREESRQRPGTFSCLCRKAGRHPLRDPRPTPTANARPDTDRHGHATAVPQKSVSV